MYSSEQHFRSLHYLFGYLNFRLSMSLMLPLLACCREKPKMGYIF